MLYIQISYSQSVTGCLSWGSNIKSSQFCSTLGTFLFSVCPLRCCYIMYVVHLCRVEVFARVSHLLFHVLLLVFIVAGVCVCVLLFNV